MSRSNRVKRQRLPQDWGKRVQTEVDGAYKKEFYYRLNSAADDMPGIRILKDCREMYPGLSGTGNKYGNLGVSAGDIVSTDMWGMQQGIYSRPVSYPRFTDPDNPSDDRSKRTREKIEITSVCIKGSIWVETANAASIEGASLTVPLRVTARLGLILWNAPISEDEATAAPWTGTQRELGWGSFTDPNCGCTAWYHPADFTPLTETNYIYGPPIMEKSSDETVQNSNETLTLLWEETLVLENKKAEDFDVVVDTPTYIFPGARKNFEFHMDCSIIAEFKGHKDENGNEIFGLGTNYGQLVFTCATGTEPWLPSDFGVATYSTGVKGCYHTVIKFRDCDVNGHPLLEKS